MFPQSVKTRHRAMIDFESCYEQLCCLQDSFPLTSVKSHLKEGVLELNGDKIRMVDWAPILDSIKINKSLRCIAIRSFFQLPSSNSTKRSHFFKRKTPAICLKDVTQWMATSLRSCVAASSAITFLDLQGVPLRERDVALFSKGLEKNISLGYVSFNYCQIADRGVQIFCQAARNHPCLAHVSFSGCNITHNGTVAIAKLIKHQSTLRHSEAWAESLRYRIPNFNGMGGIRRITLNSNPMIGDDGLEVFNDALKDDLWLKALDFQNCGLTTKGAMALLETMQYNNTLVVLDVRQNPLIDITTLRTLLARVLMNASNGDEADYPWIKEETPKDPYSTKRYRPTRSSNRSSGRKSAVKSSAENSSIRSRIKSTPKYKSPMAWRQSKTKRASKHGKKSVALHVSSASSDDTFTKLNSSLMHESAVLEEKHLSLNESHACIKQLKVEVINTQRKLESALECEKLLNARVMTLEVENARLKKQLNVTLENSRMKSQIEDDQLLDSIEQSFNKFHDFLNKLHNVGLGSLVSAAGLTQDFSLPISVTGKPKPDEIVGTAQKNENTNEKILKNTYGNEVTDALKDTPKKVRSKTSKGSTEDRSNSKKDSKSSTESSTGDTKKSSNASVTDSKQLKEATSKPSTVSTTNSSRHVRSVDLTSSTGSTTDSKQMKKVESKPSVASATDSRQLKKVESKRSAASTKGSGGPTNRSRSGSDVSGEKNSEEYDEEDFPSYSSDMAKDSF